MPLEKLSEKSGETIFRKQTSAWKYIIFFKYNIMVDLQCQNRFIMKLKPILSRTADRMDIRLYVCYASWSYVF